MIKSSNYRLQVTVNRPVHDAIEILSRRLQVSKSDVVSYAVTAFFYQVTDSSPSGPAPVLPADLTLPD